MPIAEIFKIAEYNFFRRARIPRNRGHWAKSLLFRSPHKKANLVFSSHHRHDPFELFNPSVLASRLVEPQRKYHNDGQCALSHHPPPISFLLSLQPKNKTIDPLVFLFSKIYSVIHYIIYCIYIYSTSSIHIVSPV